MESGLLYTNYYTTAPRQCFFHRCGGLISHVREHVRIRGRANRRVAYVSMNSGKAVQSL